MVHTFQSIDTFLYSIENEITDCLFEYKLLEKLDRNVKKIIFYYFVKNYGERIKEDPDLLFFHDHCFTEDHELFKLYDRDKTTVFLNKICVKLKRVTNRLFFLKNMTRVPEKAHVHDLDGGVVDEVLLLKVQNPVDPKKLKSFLEENSLKDLFSGLSKKVC